MVTGGRRLMDWLLSAASVEGRPAQPDAVRTLQHLLATRAGPLPICCFYCLSRRMLSPGTACAASTAAALLARPGAVPRLLALAGRKGEAGALAASLQAAAPAVRLPPSALLDDLSSTLRLVRSLLAPANAPAQCTLLCGVLWRLDARHVRCGEMQMHRHLFAFSECQSCSKDGTWDISSTCLPMPLCGEL